MELELKQQFLDQRFEFEKESLNEFNWWNAVNENVAIRGKVYVKPGTKAVCGEARNRGKVVNKLLMH